MTTTTKPTESVDLDRLQAIADRVDARGLFNASCDIREWIVQARAALARRAPAQQDADERAQFEAEVRDLDVPANALNRWPDGRYLEEQIEAYWAGWQWRARATQPVGQPDFHFQQSAPNSAPTSVSGQGETAPAANAVALSQAECETALRWLDVTRLYAFAEPEDEALAAKLRASPAAEKAGDLSGWKLVPIEPTQEMFNAARTSASGSNTEKLLMASYWRGMLAAAPDRAPAADAGELSRCQALHAAVAAIYFDDSSDFRSALGSIVRYLDPALAGECLGRPKAAYDQACARLDAARAAAVGAAGQAEQAVEPTAGIPKRAWSKEAEMTESWIAAQAVEPAGQRAVGDLKDSDIDEIAEGYDLYSIQDGGRVSRDSLRSFARDMRSFNPAPQPSAGQAAAGPVAFMYQDDQDRDEPGTGSCVVSKARCRFYRNETPLYAAPVAATPKPAALQEKP